MQVLYFNLAVRVDINVHKKVHGAEKKKNYTGKHTFLSHALSRKPELLYILFTIYHTISVQIIIFYTYIMAYYCVYSIPISICAAEKVIYVYLFL